jgi:hypothetical protein
MTDSQTLTVDLGGEERELRLSASAVRYAEERHDVSLDLQELLQNPVAVVPRLVQICLLPYDEDVTEAQAAKWMVQCDREEEVEDFLLIQLERVVDIMGKSSTTLQKGLPKVPDDQKELMERAMTRFLERQSNGSTGKDSTA